MRWDRRVEIEMRVPYHDCVIGMECVRDSLCCLEAVPCTHDTTYTSKALRDTMVVDYTDPKISPRKKRQSGTAHVL